jgi:LysR family glycine cleavage system transcriptional activator
VASFNDVGLMLQASEQGLGLAVVRELLAADALRDGRLARLFDVSVVLDRVQPYYLVYPPALKNWPPLIALRDWVRHEFDCSLKMLHGAGEPAPFNES